MSVSYSVVDSGKLPGADLLGIEPVSALLNQSPKGNSTEIPGAWSKQDRA